jgi:hypothetical protein
MYQSSSPPREILLVDFETGIVLQHPPEVTVSERYVNSHPFIRYTGTHVVVGPDADKVASGAGGQDYMLYEVLGKEIGSLYLRREV